MDFLKKIASRETRASGGGNWFTQGRGVVIVDELIYKEQTEDGPTFIGTFVVETSESIEGAVNDKGQPEKANPPGSAVSWPQKLQKFKSAPGNVKAFVLELTGEDEAEISEEALESGTRALVSKAQPARGMRIAYETYRRAKKEKKNEMLTLIDWAHVPNQTKEEIAARRAQLEKRAADAEAAPQ